MKVKSESEVAQFCLTLSDPMDHSLPGYSIHGISQARVLEWGATAFSIAEHKKELKSILMKVKVKKLALKINMTKTKIMATSPITSWQIEGGIVETVTDFIFLDSKITVDYDSTHEIKRHLLLGGKAMTNLD